MSKRDDLKKFAAAFGWEVKNPEQKSFDSVKTSYRTMNNTMHYATEYAEYACNKKIVANVEKLTRDKQKVSCVNCIRLLNISKNSEKKVVEEKKIMSEELDYKKKYEEAMETIKTYKQILYKKRKIFLCSECNNEIPRVGEKVIVYQEVSKGDETKPTWTWKVRREQLAMLHRDCWDKKKENN